MESRARVASPALTRIFVDGFSVDCLTMTTEIHGQGDRRIGPRPRFGERQHDKAE
jgi:hypothetical protein